jgi:hypothetical protein
METFSEYVKDSLESKDQVIESEDEDLTSELNDDELSLELVIEEVFEFEDEFMNEVNEIVEKVNTQEIAKITETIEKKEAEMKDTLKPPPPVQKGPVTVRLVTKDGKVLYGTLLSPKTSPVVKIKTMIGVIGLGQENISEIKEE